MNNAKNNIEQVADESGKVLAVIVRAEYEPEQTTFVTPGDFAQQLGFVVYGAGKTIAPHVHLPIERHLRGTSEAIIIRRGRTILTVYDNDRKETYKSTLKQGDAVVLMGGGHGFEMLKDTVLLTVKQGPYTDLKEKERFE